MITFENIKPTLLFKFKIKKCYLKQLIKVKQSDRCTNKFILLTVVQGNIANMSIASNSTRNLMSLSENLNSKRLKRKNLV